MFLIESVFALLIALLLSAILITVVDRRGPGPWSGFLFFFMLLYLAVWAGGVWITPAGPTILGVGWLTYLVLGLVVMLLLAAVTPGRKRLSAPARAEPDQDVESVESREIVFSIFFWILVVVLLATIVSRYAWGR
jgi:hypothetical protein